MRKTDPSLDAKVTSPLRGEVAAQRRVRGSVLRSRALRSNSSDAEDRFWQMVRGRQVSGAKFVRQFPVGPYFADFACREAALVVELDGGQHADNARDDIRTAYLNLQGYSVLRFWNDDVLTNMEGVYQALVDTLALNPSPDLRFAPATLSPQGRGARGARSSTTTKRSYRLNADPISE
jgi:very-short-patch-repair endonuclease